MQFNISLFFWQGEIPEKKEILYIPSIIFIRKHMNIPYILKAQIKVWNYKAINIRQTQKHNGYLISLTFLKHKGKG